MLLKAAAAPLDNSTPTVTAATDTSPMDPRQPRRIPDIPPTRCRPSPHRAAAHHGDRRLDSTRLDSARLGRRAGAIVAGWWRPPRRRRSVRRCGARRVRVAADRLTVALGVPLPRCRPRVTAAAVGTSSGRVFWSSPAGTPSAPTCTRTRWPRWPVAGTCRHCSTGTSCSARTGPPAGLVSAGSTSTTWCRAGASPGRCGGGRLQAASGGVTLVSLCSAAPAAPAC